MLGERPGHPWWSQVGFCKQSLLRELGAGGVGLWVSGMQSCQRKLWEEAVGESCGRKLWQELWQELWQ